jgi:hypothetical protein
VPDASPTDFGLRTASAESTVRIVARLAAAAGVIVTGVVAGVALHDHQFAVIGHMVVNGRLSVDHVPTLPSWRDPLALLCAFGATAAAVFLTRRPRRVGLAVGVVGCALAGAVYVHQQAVHTLVCPPGALCVSFPPAPGLWSYPASLLIIAAGIAVAVLLVLLCRWRVPDWLHLRHR